MPILNLQCAECGATSTRRLRDIDADRPIVICDACHSIVPLPNSYRLLITHLNIRAAEAERTSAVDALPEWLREKRFF